MEKKAYTQPAIVRVKLNPEQAVLGICSTRSRSTSQGNFGGGICLTDGRCRGSLRTTGADNMSGS